MLFSATSTRKTEDLIKLALKKEPMYVGIEDKTNDMPATVSGLEQGYVICPSEKRLLLLFTFLKKNRKKKVMVFFSSCMSVKYHNELFNYIDLPVMCIHGKQKQTKRTTTFFQFCNADTGILLCTENLPAVISPTLLPRRSSESGILNVTADLFVSTAALMSSLIGSILMFELFTKPFLSTAKN